MKQINYFSFSLLALTSARAYNFNFPSNTSQPVAWNISVNPEFINEVSIKAKLYRPSTDFIDTSNANWLEGPPREHVAGLANHWAENFDWSKLQDEINANYSHYALTVRSGFGYDRPVPLHFVHERSVRTDAMPLLLIHGWPSTFLEWSQVIKPLTTPTNPEDQHYHIVAVDIPGFGFSPAPVQSGMGPRQLAVIFGNLMQELGYSRYGVISTDLGQRVGMWMCEIVSDRIIGHYTDFANVATNATDLERYARNETTEEENAYIVSSQAMIGSHSAYSAAFSQSALAVGQAMADTPVGFAAWISYLLRKSNGGFEYTYDDLIERTLMLLIPEPWSNMRLYRETFTAEANALGFTTVPTGFSRWSWAGGPIPELANIQMAPRAWLERSVNLVYLSTFDSGGHFPAETRPETYANDARQFFSSLTY